MRDDPAALADAVDLGKNRDKGEKENAEGSYNSNEGKTTTNTRNTN
jgi:hypothetical protein